MPIVMGIDGGGSTIRVVVTGDDLSVLGESKSETVNPSIIGHDSAAQRIRDAMQTALQNAGILPYQVDGVGIGVAGAAAQHSEAWLREVVSPVLPHVFIVPSSDLEIALVGARGERRGILILAGTGSAAYGVNDAGESALIGGWGYLLGDEGSGYWIGMEALKAIIRQVDRLERPTNLTPAILSSLGLGSPRDLVAWIYDSQLARNREIAELTPLVMQSATEGDEVAKRIISNAAAHLTVLVWSAAKQLNILWREGLDLPIAFAGGLLDKENLLTQELCRLLKVNTYPVSIYPPVIGAALLALLRLKAT